MSKYFIIYIILFYSNTLFLFKVKFNSIENQASVQYINIKIPTVDRSSVSYRIRIIDVGEASRALPSHLKGMNSFQMKDISDSCVLDDQNKGDEDITMVIGNIKQSKEKLTLCLRYHQPISGAKNFGIAFYQYAKKKLAVGRNFYEVCLILLLLFYNVILQQIFYQPFHDRPLVKVDLVEWLQMKLIKGYLSFWPLFQVHHLINLEQSRLFDVAWGTQFCI